MFDFFKRAKAKYNADVKADVKPEVKQEQKQEPRQEVKQEVTQEQRNYAIKKLAMSIPALRCICECSDKSENDEDYIESLEICADMLQSTLESAREHPTNRASVKSCYEGMIKAISAKL